MSSTVTVSRQCAQGLHGFCKDTAATCACNHCHLGPCTVCSDDNLQKMYDGLCFACERKRAKLAQVDCTTSCDRCGASGAFRNPGHRRNEYLCTTCHGVSGESLVLTPGVAHLAVPCKGSDISDPLHVWVHIRGSRFQCLCGEKKYDSALRSQRSREMRMEMFGPDDAG